MVKSFEHEVLDFAQHVFLDVLDLQESECGIIE
jgi:hypothetical protein